MFLAKLLNLKKSLDGTVRKISLSKRDNADPYFVLLLLTTSFTIFSKHCGLWLTKHRKSKDLTTCLNSQLFSISLNTTQTYINYGAYMRSQLFFVLYTIIIIITLAHDIFSAYVFINSLYPYHSYTSKSKQKQNNNQV